MSLVGGLFGSFLAAVCMAAVLGPATNNLSPLTRAVVLAGLLGLALLLGLITGSTIGRRSRAQVGSVRLFSAIAGAVCGGLLGGALFAALLAAYVRDYGAWPSGTVEQVFTVLALPALSALGLCLGGIAGFGIGGLSGLVLSVAVPRRG